jgi:hypothetical protein
VYRETVRNFESKERLGEMHVLRDEARRLQFRYTEIV